MATGEIELVRSIDVPREEAFAQITSSLGWMEWLCHEARLDARPGGRLYAYWATGYYAVGDFTAVEPEERLAFTWQGRGEPASGKVEVTLAPERAGQATGLTLRHSGFGSGGEWARLMEAMKGRWVEGLDNLVSVLQEGVDLRLFDRPMLGVSGGTEVTPELVRQRGLAVDHGLMITDFVDSMGAQAAGLSRGDVVVAFGEEDVLGWETLVAALAKHEVGDTVDTAFWRGPQLLHAQVTLLGRPRPHVPPTPAAAAETLRGVNEQLAAELRRAVSGAPEELLARRPVQGEWSPNECLAHLLITERTLQQWLALRLQGEPMPYPATGLDAWLRATMEVWPSSAALLFAFEQAQAQTAAMVEALPPAFLERRASFVATCDMLCTSMPYHVRAHIAQVKEAVAANGR
jgi:uncharacterized protein YndB with AHSA1/START domain